MYIARFGHRHTATDAIDKSIFCIRNPAASAYEIRIRKIIIGAGFDETTAVDNGSAHYALTRYTVGATGNMTGGASPVREKTDTDMATSCVTDACILSGALLTDTDIVYAGNFHDFSTTTDTDAGTTVEYIEFEDPFVLHPGQGLTLRLGTAASVGARCYGSIWWSEVGL